MCKSVFLVVNASLPWLNNVSCVYLLVLALASHWLEGLCKFYANAGENENHA